MPYRPRSKYGARKCRRHTPPHASERECRRADELRLLERAGEIRNLCEQVPIQLAPSVVMGGRKKPALRYIADFSFEENHDGKWVQVLEDATGMMTPVKRIKLHLVMANYGIEVRLS